jgi:hypothetical protein
MEFTQEELLQELESCKNTILFLHHCLIKPETNKYAYPEHTQHMLLRLQKILPERHYCPHSGFHPGCKSCEEHPTYLRVKQSIDEKLAGLDQIPTVVSK